MKANGISAMTLICRKYELFNEKKKHLGIKSTKRDPNWIHDDCYN